MKNRLFEILELGFKTILFQQCEYFRLLRFFYSAKLRHLSKAFAEGKILYHLKSVVL